MDAAPGEKSVVPLLVGVAVAAVAAVFLVVLLVTGSDSGGGGGDDVAARTGAAIYADECAACHGADGEGGVGSALAGGAVVDSLGDQAAIEAVIVEGRDTMPAYGESLSPDEIAEVTAYIREF